MNRPPNGADTRTRILDVAVPLFAEAGYDGVSMRAIAKAVGIQAASLYNHFPDKQSLYLGAMAHAFSDKAKGISETARAPGTPNGSPHRTAPKDHFLPEICPQWQFHSLASRALLSGYNWASNHRQRSRGRKEVESSQSVDSSSQPQVC